MTKILGMVPNPADGTSAYRAMGPMIGLEKSGDIEFTLGAESLSYYDWHQLRRHDIFFAQRPCLPVHAHAISVAKQKRIPVWVDLDDNLLSVPIDNPTYDTYSNPQNQASLIQCLQMADIVTVTTEQLKAVVSEYCINVVVVPNAYDDIDYGITPVRPERRNKIVAWRGGDSHVKDLMESAEAIVNVAKSKPDWKWAFLGYNPFFITEHLASGSYQVFAFSNTAEYMDQIKGLAHAIQIVPLSDSLFNRCKSNIAWIEASYAGARTVAPDWQEWNKPGVFNYDESKTLTATLAYLMDQEATLTRDDTGWDAILSGLTLSKTNEIRKQVIASLVKR